MAGMGLSGLASGVDTSGLVDQLMALERRSVTRLQLQSSQITTRDSGLKDIQAKLSALKSAAAALRSPALYATRQTAESSSASVASATIAAGAPTGSTTFTVQRLAGSAQRTFAFTPDAGQQTITLQSSRTGSAPMEIVTAPNASLTDVVAQINGRSDVPVFAAAVTQSDGTQKLVLSARTVGPDAPGANSSGFTVSASSAQVVEDPLLAKPGTSAAYRVIEAQPDGTQKLTNLTSDTNVVDNLVPGVKVTLKGTSATEQTISVSSPVIDREGVKSKIKGFVDAYNSVVTATKGKVTEKSVPDPKTNSDALKGQLFGDNGLNSMLDAMRSSVGTTFSGMGLGPDDLTDIGISTGAIGAGRSASGTLVIDDAKLTAALDVNLSGVRQLLAGTAAEGGQAAVEGVADRFSAFVDKQVGSTGSLDLRLKGSESERRRLADATTRTESRLEVREKRMRAQFAAMESALQASQTQQAWLSGQISSLPRGSGY